jgi:hypothetical protein
MTKENRTQLREVQGRIASTPGRHCPYVVNPFEECFVTHMNSQNIDQAIHYCGDDFEECEIYQRATKREPP